MEPYCIHVSEGYKSNTTTNLTFLIMFLSARKSGKLAVYQHRGRVSVDADPRREERPGEDERREEIS